MFWRFLDFYTYVYRKTCVCIVCQIFAIKLRVREMVFTGFIYVILNKGEFYNNEESRIASRREIIKALEICY